MSDPIKTQHGTIGLLMAECEQLRRDLAAEEQRHHSACDDWIRERRRADKLQSELAQAKRLLRNIVSNLHCNEDIDQELYDAAEFLKGTSGSTPDRPAITN